MLSAQLQADTQLALRLVEFNVQVARFTHRSWYGESTDAQVLCRSIFDTDGTINSRAETRVSEWLLHELDLHDALDWEMQEVQKRPWLLDRPSIERLAQELALAMHREWLLRVIDATQLRALRMSVGERAIRFVVEDLPGGLFHCRAPVVSFEVDSSVDLGMKLQEAGARTLMALLQPAWRAVYGRAQLYFERSQKLHEVAPCNGVDCGAALELICNWLVPRRFPEWAWCF